MKNNHISVNILVLPIQCWGHVFNRDPFAINQTDKPQSEEEEENVAQSKTSFFFGKS